MNDFTKEELETILKLIINDPMKYHDAIESKLDDLIANYCEHLHAWEACGTICRDCGARW
jgi:hypothetical protein